jgi:hypothetical protein
MATDDGYMQFVVSLLDELDCQPAKAIKRELEENFGDDCKIVAPTSIFSDTLHSS